MKVRSVGVRRVWDCMLCACVSEEGGDGEGADSEAPSLLSYTLGYVSLAEKEVPGGGQPFFFFHPHKRWQSPVHKITQGGVESAYSAVPCAV